MRTLSTRDAHGIATALEERAPFVTYGALAGHSAVTTYGRLPSDWRRTLEARGHLVDYVLTSYATPIAWHDKEAGWIVPEVRHSVTTSRHQSKIAYALHLTGEGVRFE